MWSDAIFTDWKLYFQVFKHYFEELEEESLRDNFVVVVSTIDIEHNSVRVVILCGVRVLFSGGSFWSNMLLLDFTV